MLDRWQKDMSLVWRMMALLSYFGLFGLLLCWFAWLEPQDWMPVTLVLILFVGPLLFPLRGLLYGWPYTYAWTSFFGAILFYVWSLPRCRTDGAALAGSAGYRFQRSAFFWRDLVRPSAYPPTDVMNADTLHPVACRVHASVMLLAGVLY